MATIITVVAMVTAEVAVQLLVVAAVFTLMAVMVGMDMVF